jgi:hypothetical protein
VRHDHGVGIDGIEWADQLHETEWIGPRLSPFDSGLVTSVIPAGFEAYARLLHPVSRESTGEETVRWGQVAAWSGQPLDRLARFHDVAIPVPDLPPAAPPWDSQGPTDGTLSGGDAATLVDVLARHGVSGCWFGLWSGYGWENAVYLLAADAPAELRTNPPKPPDPIPGRVREGAQLRLPHRDYFVFTGPVEAALTFVPGQRQTPNLWWPDDRSWFVGSEIDLPWTYVGGTRELIDEVLAHPGLEALPALADDVHGMTVPPWLEAKLRVAVDELMEHGESTVEISVGAVRASLRRPTRTRRGLLRIDRDRGLPGGATGSSESYPGWGERDRLRDSARFYLLHATLGLVDG